MKFTTKFITPEALKNNAILSYTKMLKVLHKKIGADNLESRLELVSTEWANNNGYTMEINGTELVFKHISI